MIEVNRGVRAESHDDHKDAHGESPGVVLITGAGGAIGGAAVQAFLKEGFTVVGLDQNPAVTEVAEDRYRGAVVDVRDEAALAEVVAAVSTEGPLRHVIGVAGGALPQEPPTQGDPRALDPATFRSSVELNLTSQYVVFHAVLDWLLSSGPHDRTVTLTSSFNALSGQGMPAYSAAKAGLTGMMHALTAPLGKEGVRVNVVAPGTVRTPRTGAHLGADKRPLRALD